MAYCLIPLADPYLVDVRDELPLARHVHLLVVGSHFALDGEEQNLQVSLLCESAGNMPTYVCFSVLL